jgi:hypothetical protein
LGLRRIPGIPSNWGEFILSILMFGVLPLAPLIFEQIIKGYVTTASMMIGSAMYSVGVGLVCQHKLMLVPSLLAMFVLCFLHGNTMATEQEMSIIITPAFGVS